MKIFASVLIFLFALNIGSGWGQSDGVHAGVRQPVAAGRFYPGDPLKLTRAIHSYLEDAVQSSGTPPIAILAPHAGYIYSGQICADAFKQAEGHPYDLVVLLGTNHTRPGFNGVSVYPSGGYKTPLGTAWIDAAVSRDLILAAEEIAYKADVHIREHSIEVLVPFVQTLFPNAKIVAAILGSPDPALCTRFGTLLANALRDRRALIVASSDLSHYPKYDDAVFVDRQTLAAATTLDPDALRQSGAYKGCKKGRHSAF